ncbi:hypothetical protein [Streptomyces decoyicus]|uniref:hypothetical protein n=1 Tax=Streptomyces decoyicus TaxID=249567 RepID=UPI0004AB61C2|nr:hypothetical protein [Streptomyces decoyicus]KOG46845.1 hypothetical protein ADK74_11050 [Streptomyces decoyicus]QZY14370.1 hypothetical protein K7C20_03190 [Streptomyces decoyicus]
MTDSVLLGLINYLVLWFRTVLGLDVENSGYLLTAMMLGVVLTSWISAKVMALLELKRQSTAWDWKISESVEQITGEPPLTLRNWVDENLHLFG